jgi:hypothetical protein
MKRFFLVLLSLGLVLAFSASAMAVDVQISGEFYAAGMYLNKTTLNDSRYGYDRDNPSTAFYYQRLRVESDFIVAPGLKLVTRFDAMERIWGGARSEPGTPDSQSVGTRAENENIAFDWAYINYDSPIGTFMVGYGPDNFWGTTFGDSISGHSTGQIAYFKPVGNFFFGAIVYKEGDNSKSAVTAGTTTTDQDADKYVLLGVYNLNKDINFGLLACYYRDASGRNFNSWYNGVLGPNTPAYGHMSAYYLWPYFKAKFGPVALEGELEYAWGTITSETAGDSNVDIQDLDIYLAANVNLGMFYFGGQFAYLQGDDPGSSTRSGGITGQNGGMDWNPCLIMFNSDTINYWVGGIQGHSKSQVGGPMTNAWFFQGKVGAHPIPALDINASISFATADKKPDPKAYGITYANGNYGTEIDVTGTYKITNNLSYMLGFGYLFTGDYFKGYDYAGANYKTVDDFIVINKLTLTF